MRLKGPRCRAFTCDAAPATFPLEMAAPLLLFDVMEHFTTTTSESASWNRSDLWTVAAAVILPFGWVLLIPRVLRYLLR